eukprot:14705392-Heterocapsa_arctica.AAC.1
MEQAFLGGPFHPRLRESLPACRAALAQAAAKILRRCDDPNGSASDSSSAGSDGEEGQGPPQ